MDLPEHSARRPLIDELHARPFTPLEAPATLLHLAFMPEAGASTPSPADAKEHLAALLAHLGAAPPPADLRSHFVARFDRVMVKWERHTEFVTVTLTDLDPNLNALFKPRLLERLPKGWLENAPGKVMCATLLEIRTAASREESTRRVTEELDSLFNRESFAGAFVAEGLALAATDFQRDSSGFVRMAVLAEEALGPRRLGRVSQRLLELETYRALAMLALPKAREVQPRLSEIDAALERLARDGAEQTGFETERKTLEELTRIAAELEQIAASTAFRFGAAKAYDAIVNERISVLQEERALSRQTINEFMMRRYRPAMRTCWSVIERLAALSQRAERASNLLRTRVDVSLEAQNQALLESMDNRAKLQLRLQQTVEGLSVVAISYYAVSLAGYLLAPVANEFGATETFAKGVVALPIIFVVWLFVRRLRRHAVGAAEVAAAEIAARSKKPDPAE